MSFHWLNHWDFWPKVPQLDFPSIILSNVRNFLSQNIGKSGIYWNQNSKTYSRNLRRFFGFNFLVYFARWGRLLVRTGLIGILNSSEMLTNKILCTWGDRVGNYRISVWTSTYIFKNTVGELFSFVWLTNNSKLPLPLPCNTYIVCPKMIVTGWSGTVHDFWLYYSFQTKTINLSLRPK